MDRVGGGCSIIGKAAATVKNIQCIVCRDAFGKSGDDEA
jgi:hypothetical protein